MMLAVRGIEFSVRRSAWSGIEIHTSLAPTRNTGIRIWEASDSKVSWKNVKEAENGRPKKSGITTLEVNAV